MQKDPKTHLCKNRRLRTIIKSKSNQLFPSAFWLSVNSMLRYWDIYYNPNVDPILVYAKTLSRKTTFWANTVKKWLLADISGFCKIWSSNPDKSLTAEQTFWHKKFKICKHDESTSRKTVLCSLKKGLWQKIFYVEKKFGNFLKKSPGKLLRTNRQIVEPIKSVSFLWKDLQLTFNDWSTFMMFTMFVKITEWKLSKEIGLKYKWTNEKLKKCMTWGLRKVLYKLQSITAWHPCKIYKCSLFGFGWLQVDFYKTQIFPREIGTLWTKEWKIKLTF